MQLKTNSLKESIGPLILEGPMPAIIFLVLLVLLVAKVYLIMGGEKK